nr:hypothetical protein [Tanacetum cinerariifolium]
MSLKVKPVPDLQKPAGGNATYAPGGLHYVASQTTSTRFV